MINFFVLAAVVCGVLGQNDHNHGNSHVHHQTLADAVDAAFGSLDTNSNGLLEEDELKAAFLVGDLNADNDISLDEFRTAALNVTGQYTDALFHYYDHDHDGHVSVAEIHGLFLTIAHGGTLTRHEFDHFYTKLLEEIINHHGHHITGVGK